MDDLVLYFFNVRDETTGKWRKTRYRLTDETARAVYGDGNYERTGLDSGSQNRCPRRPKHVALDGPRAKFGCRIVAADWRTNWRSGIGVPSEIRTRVTAVKGRCPRPLDDGDNQTY